jgi:ABC-type nitrate/sulfonate/bicarbonate transport system ATPase subunit
VIEVSELFFGYSRPDEIFRHFDWQVAQGESWVVLGSSGCGKTTLVYLLAGLRHPMAGTVSVDGSRVAAPRTSTGLILQDHGLLPWAKAGDNVALGLKIRRVPRGEIAEKVGYWMDRLGIAPVADRYPGQLSGGQRQRVAIARTLALSPSLLLMDEPFSSLDSTTREDLQELVVSLSEGSGMTTVLVTHDIQEAVYLGRRIMVVGGAPIDSYRVVENPFARRAEFRNSPDFYLRCAEVRSLAADLMNGGVRLPLPLGEGRGEGSTHPGSNSSQGVSP